MVVDVQVNPARLAWPELRDLALAAEAAGYGAVWTFDHLAGYVASGDIDARDVQLLGALAVATSTIELGTLVVNVHNRTPAPARRRGGVGRADRGRTVHLGLGAGTRRPAAGRRRCTPSASRSSPTVADRHAHLGAVLDVLERMYDPDRPAELATFPLPTPAARVLIGVNGWHSPHSPGREPTASTSAGTHRRRDELLATAAAAEAIDRGFELSTWLTGHRTLLDPSSTEPSAMDERGIDRRRARRPGRRRTR